MFPTITDRYLFVCQLSDDGDEWCDIYALPNGSVPLKKGVLRLMFDVYNTTQLKYGSLGSEPEAVHLVRNWFSSRASGGREATFLNKLRWAFGTVRAF